MKPLQWDAAGLTNARRSEMNYCQGMGRQTKAVPGKPRDDNEEPRRGKGRRFTERSHLTEMGRDPIAAHAGVGGEYNAVGRAPSPRRERPSIESDGGGGGGGFSLDERSPMDGPESPGAKVLRSIIDASSPEGGRGEPVAGVRTGAKTDDLDPFYRTVARARGDPRGVERPTGGALGPERHRRRPRDGQARRVSNGAAPNGRRRIRCPSPRAPRSSGRSGAAASRRTGRR